MARNADHRKTEAGQFRLFDVSDAQALCCDCREIPGRRVEQMEREQPVCGRGRGPSFPTTGRVVASACRCVGRAGDGRCGARRPQTHMVGKLAFLTMAGTSLSPWPMQSIILGVTREKGETVPKTEFLIASNSMLFTRTESPSGGDLLLSYEASGLELSSLRGPCSLLT